ncbi:MAG: hypothetical protein MJE63_31905 [Proteobacteria bacterium]|nr:hypothetical protein [Pseudomonadota bacterium]
MPEFNLRIHLLSAFGLKRWGCIKRISRVFQDEDGVVTGIVETNLAEETTHIRKDSGQCPHVCPTEAISLKKLS